jgi:hypothetical protein
VEAVKSQGAVAAPIFNQTQQRTQPYCALSEIQSKEYDQLARDFRSELIKASSLA